MSLISFLQGLFGRLDSALSKVSQFGISEDFIRFGIVGTSGFLLDTATVYALRGWIGLYFAGAAGFLVAASVNWAINRFWSFRHKVHDTLRKQWLRFMLINSVGFVFNRGSFFVLISMSNLFYSEPVLAIVIGSFIGLGFNYFLSKRFVFR